MTVEDKIKPGVVTMIGGDDFIYLYVYYVSNLQYATLSVYVPENEIEFITEAYSPRENIVIL